MNVIDFNEVRKKLEEQQKKQEALNMSPEERIDDNIRALMQIIEQTTRSQAEITLKVQKQLHELIKETALTYSEAIKELQEQVNELRELLIEEKE